VDEEILSWLKEIGLKNVGYGVESGVQRILNGVKKGISLAKIEEAFRISKRLGLSTWAFFMFGLPGETEETIKRTIYMAKRLDPDFAKFFIFKPFPRIPLFRELEQKGLIRDFDFGHYGLYHQSVHSLPTLSGERISWWASRANRTFYLRPHKILRHLLRLKSREQFLLNWQAFRFLVGKF